MNKERLLHIASTDSNVHAQDNYYSSFTAAFRNPNSLYEVKRIEPIAVQIPNVFRNVEDHNNTLYFTIDGVANTIELTNGYYSSSELLAAISTAMSALVGTSSIVFQVATLANGHLLVQNTLFASKTVIITSIANSMGPHLGIPVGTDYTIQLALTALPLPPDLFVPNEILVHCDNHAEHYANSPGVFDTSVIAHIPLHGVAYGYLAYVSSSHYMASSIPIEERDLSTFTIRMTDGQYNPVYLPVNARVHIQMKIYG